MLIWLGVAFFVLVVLVMLGVARTAGFEAKREERRRKGEAPVDIFSSEEPD